MTCLLVHTYLDIFEMFVFPPYSEISRIGTITSIDILPILPLVYIFTLCLILFSFSSPPSLYLFIYHLPTYLPTYLPVSVSHLPSPSFYLYLRIYLLLILSMAPCYSWKLQCVTPKNKNPTLHNHNTISKSRNLTNYTVLLTSPCSFSNLISCSKNVLFLIKKIFF